MMQSLITTWVDQDIGLYKWEAGYESECESTPSQLILQNSLCMEGTGEKESTPSMKNEKQCLSTTESPFSKESEKQCLSTTESSFSMENINEKKSFVIYDSGLHLEDVTQLTSVPSIPTTATPTVTPNWPAQGPNLILLHLAILASFVKLCLILPSLFRSL